ncbi:DedA family protein, partial [Mycobacterium sp.]|uniref:DedA family protein n=1 Tax=Mycobacterium sp. TaxID=1785 RepID=UPI003C7620BA
MNVEALLHSIPPLAVYLVVGGVVGIESLGVPLPGEIMLVSAALMSSHDELAVSPIGVGIAAVIGAVVGDSIGYTIGRRFGMPLFDRLGRRFPKHFGPGHVALAERLFSRWGVRAVFLGRFIALLRIFAGPLAGALNMHY